MKSLTLLFAALFTSLAFAQEGKPAEPEFDSLGGNKILLERAKAMNPDAQVSVVQKRAVNRRIRFELAPEVSGVMGGEALNRTRSVGMNAYFHITPRIAIGAKYNYSFNKLTPEGEAEVRAAEQEYAADPINPKKPYPQIDHQKTEWMGLVNWFPLYGKFSLFDRKVIHFDFYALAGYGQTTLKSGPTSTYTAGGGMGLWLTQHFSTRMEMRYQTYTGQYFEGPRKLDLTVASIQMGWLL